MFINQTRWFCLALFLSPCLLNAETLRYNLQSSSSDPLLVHASASTSALGVFSLVKPRVLPFSKEAKLPKIKCTTASGSHSVEYGEEIKCSKISWAINFDKLDSLGVDVSEQNNLFSPSGWWVLFEWSDMPRLQQHSDIEVCAIKNRSMSKDVCRMLPSLNEPPLIMAWGAVSAQKFESKMQFNIYADSDKGIMHDKSWSQLLVQYNYLQQLFLTKQQQGRDIDIIWVGIDASLGALGGAAGNQAFISNYIVNEDHINRESISRLHWISGHEIFHMLSLHQTSLWVSESLAHYYGYKSLHAAGVSSQTPIEAWQSRIEKTAHANTGLYKANDKVVNDNDMSYYGLFYGKGAAFWQELDNSLVESDSSLDEFIPLLANGNISNVELNPKFLRALEGAIGAPELSRLVSKYLL